jgi:hypothetical protein
MGQLESLVADVMGRKEKSCVSHGGVEILMRNMPRVGKFVLNRLTQISPVRCLRRAAIPIAMMVAAVATLGCMFWSLRTFD